MQIIDEVLQLTRHTDNDEAASTSCATAILQGCHAAGQEGESSFISCSTDWWQCLHLAHELWETKNRLLHEDGNLKTIWG
jgi:hypothetical protein